MKFIIKNVKFHMNLYTNLIIIAIYVNKNNNFQLSRKKLIGLKIIVMEFSKKL